MTDRPWQLLDADPHDARLVDHVHPTDWTVNGPRDRHDLVVIGGGTAGLVSAMIAAALGARASPSSSARSWGATVS